MTKPLALVTYENLLPGSQLPARLEILGYRVVTVMDPAAVVETAEREKPMLVVMDLTSTKMDICTLIKHLRDNPATCHLPIITFVDVKNANLQPLATQAGATIVANDSAFIAQLPHLLEQALQID